MRDPISICSWLLNWTTPDLQRATSASHRPSASAIRWIPVLNRAIHRSRWTDRQKSPQRNSRPRRNYSISRCYVDYRQKSARSFLTLSRSPPSPELRLCVWFSRCHGFRLSTPSNAYTVLVFAGHNSAPLSRLGLRLAAQDWPSRSSSLQPLLPQGCFQQKHLSGLFARLQLYQIYHYWETIETRGLLALRECRTLPFLLEVKNNILHYEKSVFTPSVCDNAENLYCETTNYTPSNFFSGHFKSVYWESGGLNL